MHAQKSINRGFAPQPIRTMATKIRLQRHGRKGRPIFNIVIADERSKRDGRYIEKIGQYSPNTQPATIDLDVDKALDWVQKGAVPTDTARAILSYKGVLLRKHLLDGVKKGALTEDQANEKYEAWLNEKESKIEAHTESILKSKADLKAEKLKKEAEISQKRADELRAAAAPEVEEAPAAAPAEEAEEAKAETIDDAAAAAEGSEEETEK